MPKLCKLKLIKYLCTIGALHILTLSENLYAHLNVVFYSRNIDSFFLRFLLYSVLKFESLYTLNVYRINSTFLTLLYSLFIVS